MHFRVCQAKSILKGMLEDSHSATLITTFPVCVTHCLSLSLFCTISFSVGISSGKHNQVCMFKFISTLSTFFERGNMPNVCLNIYPHCQHFLKEVTCSMWHVKLNNKIKSLGTTVLGNDFMLLHFSQYQNNLGD